MSAKRTVGFTEAAPAGVFRRIPENRRPRELQSMAPGVVFYSAAAGGSRHCRSAATGCRLSLPTGSMWQSATPTHSSKQTSVGVWGSAKRSGASPSRGGNAAP